MKIAIAIGIYLGVITFIGWLSNLLGVTQSDVSVFLPSEPGGGGFLNNVIAPFKWAWDSVSGYFQIVTFQAEGLSPFLTVGVFWTMQTIYGLFLYKLIRG